MSENISLEQNKTYKLIKGWFKNDLGGPFEPTASQVEIFEEIAQKRHPRLHIETYTQYGKSEVVSQAVLARVTNFNEKWAIVAPTVDKAKIIMGYVIKHIFDNDYFKNKFEVKASESLEHIRRERSRSRVTFRNSDGIGEIYILSAEASRKGEDAGNRLMGFGAPNIIEDESALIPDSIHTKVLRMLGGHKDNFLGVIGNPFKRNHFLRSFNNVKYHKVLVDWKRGMEEGRQPKEFFDEMRQECADDILWGVLYECRFPEEDMIDTSGYSPLFFEHDLQKAETDQFQFYGEDRLGCDVAGAGSNFSVIVRRSANGSEILYKEHNPDIMSFTGIILNMMEKYRVEAKNTFVDVVGIGKGVYDRLCELGRNVMPVNAGEQAQENGRYFNKRAEMYSRLSKWIKEGGCLLPNIDWKQLISIRYKVMSDRKIQLKSKNQMLLDGIKSPDVADALSLTFSLPEARYSQNTSTTRVISGVGSQKGELKASTGRNRIIKGLGR